MSDPINDIQRGEQTSTETTAEQQEQNFKMQLIEVCAQKGHDTWLAAQTKRVFAFPNKSNFEGQQTRTGMVPFATAKFIQDELNAKGDINPQTFFVRFIEDVSAHEEFKFLIQPEKRKYIEKLVGLANSGDSDSLEIFQDLMLEIATQRIHDNDAYGQTAYDLLKYMGVDAQSFNEGLSSDVVERLQKIRNNIPSLQNAKDFASLSNILLESNDLFNMMVFSHGNWRMDERARLLGENTDLNNDEIALREGIISARYVQVGINLDSLLNEGNIKAIQDFIQITRNDSHLSQTLKNEHTFNLITTIGHTVERYIYENPKASEEYIAQLKNIRNNLLSLITYDANPAIIDGILQLAGVDLEDVNPKEM